ncbi:MAG: PQQ-binding-like beta-propeller repeat protein [Chloroflexi bacterium]|nr:PQQ-binding-like beta-propeller repeat protein [Chloroflexota bacterium]MBP8058346.1 PQQ-binding-like beta-propeller repeat protein [Chloroflexota bacterium]
MNSGLDWPTYMNNPQRTGAITQIDFEPPYKLAWSSKLGDYVSSSPIIGNGLVYIPHDYRLYALDLETGKLQWQNDKVDAIDLTSATLGYETLYVCGYEYLYFVNPVTGDIEKRLDKGMVSTSPCVCDEIVFWPDRFGLNAANAHTGVYKWRYPMERGMKLTPCSDEGIVCCADEGTVYALDVSSGELLWKWPIVGAHSPAYTTAIDAGRLFVPTKEGVFALKLTTGELLWQQAIAALAPVCVCEGTIYVASYKQIYALATENGEVLWVNEPKAPFFADRSAPIVIGNYLHIGGGLRSTILSFDRNPGSNRPFPFWHHPTRDMVYSSPAYANGRLVVGCQDGHVYCLEQM